MGGRGASSGSSGSSVSGELVLPNGSKIEFDGTLNYDGNDGALSGNTRAAVVSWEAKRVKNKIEYAYAVDANGNPIGSEIRGGKGRVHVPISYHATKDAVFTHIHPRGDGLLGGTFSNADLQNFANYGNKTSRAAAKEGTYSISKTAKFNKTGFKSYISQCNHNYSRSINSLSKALAAEYKSGKISYSDYLHKAAKASNTALVKLHSDYSKGQKQYGYTYTLERSN